MKHLHIYLSGRTQKRTADAFEESKHPRGEGGRFGAAGNTLSEARAHHEARKEFHSKKEAHYRGLEASAKTLIGAELHGERGVGHHQAHSLHNLALMVLQDHPGENAKGGYARSQVSGAEKRHNDIMKRLAKHEDESGIETREHARIE